MHTITIAATVFTLAALSLAQTQAPEDPPVLGGFAVQGGDVPAKGSSTARGYGSQHQRTRARWVPRVATGSVECARCGQPIRPDQPWDLGHTPDRQAYTGPEHQRCNRSEGATRGNAQRRRRDVPAIRPERDW